MTQDADDTDSILELRGSKPINDAEAAKVKLPRLTSEASFNLAIA